MPTWRGSDPISTDANASHRFYFESTSDQDEFEEKSEAAFKSGLNSIDDTITLLQNEDYDDEMKLKLDWLFAKPDDRHIKYILQVLEITRNGLASDGLKVKIFSKDDVTTKSQKAAGKYVAGYVRRHDAGIADQLRLAVAGPKGSWTSGAVRLPQGGISHSTHRGSIHVNTKLFRNAPGEVDQNIVHEATHKFAGTMDFEERGYFSSGMIGNKDNPQKLTRGEAINNADSFAWLCKLFSHFRTVRSNTPDFANL